ncbi:c-type cytochrome [Alsobacter sp. R-9]
MKGRVAFAFVAALTVPVSAAFAQKRSALPPAPPNVEACAPCHGLDGIAKDVEVPHLAGQNVVYLYNQLRAFRTGKRPHKEMRYMSRHLSEAEMEALADYYAALPRE